jgi:hypothetical protein
MTSQQQLQGPARKKCRVNNQSHEEHCTQITALRKAATCAIPHCGFIFEDAAHICSVCSAGVCPGCHEQMEASDNIPKDRCSIGGCKLAHGGGSPVELRTGGLRIELAASVVQACAGEGCFHTGTWSELRAHLPWCVAAKVSCPVCEEPLKRSDLKKHLTEEHDASLVTTTRWNGQLPDKSHSITIGAWEISGPESELSVAVVVGRCRFDHCVGVKECACPFVVATAQTNFCEEGIPTTHVCVSTAFTEVTALRHPMGHCDVSMHAIEKSPCGALVSSRCTRAGAVLARSDCGWLCGLVNCVDVTCDGVICKKRALSVRHARQRVVFRFTPISANKA